MNEKRSGPPIFAEAPASIDVTLLSRPADTYLCRSRMAWKKSTSRFVSIREAARSYRVRGCASFTTRIYDDMRSRKSPPEVSRIWRCGSEEHTSELQSPCNLVCRLLLENKKNVIIQKC